MYGVGGERRLTEFELDDLPGYEGSKPVRVGNAASEQFQLDVFGEVAGVVALGAERSGGSSRICGLAGARSSSTWRRSGASPTTASGRRAGRSGTTRTPRSWRGSCSTARCESPSGSSSRRRWSAGRRSATRFTGGLRAGIRHRAPHLHAVLRLEGARRERPQHPARGLSARRRRARHGNHRRRVAGAGRDGFVSRYSTAETDDGLAGDEGQFLACSFWLVSALALNGRADEARTLFDRLLELRNDLGLLAEEYDVARAAAGRQLPAGVQSPRADRRGARHRGCRGDCERPGCVNAAPVDAAISRRRFLPQR